jgi:hypothetical protein
MIVRFVANAAIVVGFYLLARAIYGAANGSVVAQLFPESQESFPNIAVVLGLSLPVPLHVISIGLLLQRRWLPHSWARISLLAVVISGCWLGAVLAIKLFVFR